MTCQQVFYITKKTAHQAHNLLASTHSLLYLFPTHGPGLFEVTSQTSAGVEFFCSTIRKIVESSLSNSEKTSDNVLSVGGHNTECKILFQPNEICDLIITFNESLYVKDGRTTINIFASIFAIVSCKILD